MAELNEFIKKYNKELGLFFSKRIAEIEAEIDSKIGDLLKEKAQYQDALKALKSTPDNNQLKFAEIPDAPVYSKSASVIDKVIFVTSKNGYLTLNEIAGKIEEMEHGIDMANLKAHLSAVLSMDIKRDKPRLNRRKRDSENKWEYMAK